MVQHAVLQRYTKYSLTKDETMLVGDKIEEENLDSNITWQKQGSYYRINNEQFKELGITDIKDTYIVNYKTGEVYNETQKTTNDGNILYICAVE